MKKYSLFSVLHGYIWLLGTFVNSSCDIKINTKIIKIAVINLAVKGLTYSKVPSHSSFSSKYLLQVYNRKSVAIINFKKSPQIASTVNHGNRKLVITLLPNYRRVMYITEKTFTSK